MTIRLFETLIQSLVVVDSECILVQNCFVVVDLVYILILSSVVMKLMRYLHLSNRLMNQIFKVYNLKGIFFV